MWVLAHGQRFVWFERLTGTKGGSPHGFFYQLTQIWYRKEREGQGLKDVWGYMIFWGGFFSTLVMFTCKGFFKESRISIIMVRASSMANVDLKFYLFVCLLLNTVEFFQSSLRFTEKLSRRYRDFQYIPFPHICITSLIVNIPYQSVAHQLELMNLH